ncbi:glycosyltransferase family protein [Roseivivax sediminis]|uniref:Glycosyltransferase involved in cell wall bisynthesis n=1 Tax=Roseivivax sediminis TaxID=936889 RepID=A0A1I1UJ71_9RHOB|nr:glycosyltransferase [Roseivivax sediminis]SFD68793.1 Glycosyltransferase involved in cell wall bisynthesis [Roseivivax sediminis]
MTGIGSHSGLVVLNSNTHTRNIHITKMILDAAREMLGRDRVHYATYDNVIATCRAEEAPLLLVIDGQRLNTAVLRAARLHTRTMALWLFDDPYNMSENVTNARIFDHVFTNEPVAVPQYDGEAHFLPLGGEVHPGGVPDESRKSYDVFFCGSAWPNRVVQLNRLLTLCPDLDWRISLTYNPHLPPFPLNLPESAYLRTLAFDDMLEMSARSRVTLDLNRAFGGTDRSAEALSATYPGPRVFELAGRGAFQLSVNTPGLRDAFDDKEVPSCDGVTDLAHTLRKWIADPEGRAAAAGRAQAKVAAKHTYVHRLTSIFDVCTKGDTAPATAGQAPTGLAPAKAPAAPARRQKILFVVHNIRGDNAFGGLELHQEIVARYLSANYDIYFFWAHPSEKGRDVVLLDKDYNTLDSRETPVSDTSVLLQHNAFERFFSEMLQKYDIDLTHFFHFREVPPSLAAVSRALGVPYTVSLHDYYMIFRNFTLADGDGNFMGEKIDCLNEMERLTAKIWDVSPGAYMRRHSVFFSVLQGAETIIHISDAGRKIFETAFPGLEDHPSVRIHHAPLPSANYKVFRSGAKRRPLTSEPSFVLLGNMAAHKGGPYLIKALEALKEFKGHLHFHGSMNKDIETRVKRAVGDRATFHGRYAPGSLDLTAYDFSLHLSTWPETYCQTLSEAWAMGVVPIVTDIGALGERVVHMKNGVKVNPQNPSSLAAVFDYIAKSPQSFEHLRDIPTEGLFMDPPRAAAQYEKAFADVLVRTSGNRARPMPEIAPAPVTVDVLGRAARRDIWTRTGATPPQEPVRPVAVRGPYWTDHEAARLSMVETLRGNVDRIDLAKNATTPARIDGHDGLDHEEDVFVDDTLNIRGWIKFDELPVEIADPAKARPVVALQSEGSDMWALFEARTEKRGDLAEYFGEEATEWGLFSVAHIANPNQDLSGRVRIGVGLLTPEGRVVALTALRTVTGHMTKRPANRK